MNSLIDVLLAPGALRSAFQPIVEVSGEEPRLHGVECLTRGPNGTHFESAEVMFDYVRRKGDEARIDRSCILLALESVHELASRARISLNVHAATLARDADFGRVLADALQRWSIAPTQVTLEIVEHSAPWVTPTLLRVLDRIRATGLGIALDDVGHGHSNFKMIVDLRPEYLKLDRYFVEGIERDAVRQAVVECVVQLAARVGARVVLEGVGTESELAMARALGVEIVQGFFFARPMSIDDLRRHALLRDRACVHALDVARPESRSSDHGSP